MTRINCIPPAELSTQHLIAEYRELPRIFSLVRAAIARGEIPDDARNPTEYVLGKGHIRFFYPRLGYLIKRQTLIIDEMHKRGYRPQYTNPAPLIKDIPKEWCGDWQPDAQAVEINKARIDLRNNSEK